MWLAISIRAKQNDLLRLHGAHYLLTQILELLPDLFILAFDLEVLDAVHNHQSTYRNSLLLNITRR